MFNFGFNSDTAIDYNYLDSEEPNKDMYILGYDYVYLESINAAIKDRTKLFGGKVDGEDYLTFGNNEVAHIISKIKKALPDGGIIINTLNFDQNVAFFKEIQDPDIITSRSY